MDAPDVVGAAESAEILGVEKQRISRWREGEKMPPTVANLRSTPVWMRADVLRLAKDGKWSGPPPPRLDLVGLAEAAAERGVDRSQIGRWRRAGEFPAPAVELKAGPLWWRAQVAGFEPSRPRRRAAA